LIMAEIDLANRRFSFRRRPVPVPGDLRIGWRVALIIVMLGSSRANRASLAKLHIINDAIRSSQQDRLKIILSGPHAAVPWNLRVEPAFARAVDFVVGEKLAIWTKATGRAALQLTKTGVDAAAAVMGIEDALVEERAAVAELAKLITEATVAGLLGEKGRA
jgi:hypothetical protein